MNHEQIRQVLDFCHAVTDWQGEPNSRAKDDAIAICEAALAEPEDEPSTVLRLIDTIKYLVGIAERGEGRKARDDELPEQFVLGYVKRLEEALAEPSEPVAEVAGDYNTKHIIFLPAGIALEVGDKLFTHPASKPEPSEQNRDAKDAERYRHLRDTGSLDDLIWKAIAHAKGDDKEAYRKGLNGAIDLAIKKAKTP